MASSQNLVHRPSRTGYSIALCQFFICHDIKNRNFVKVQRQLLKDLCLECIPPQSTFIPQEYFVLLADFQVSVALTVPMVAFMSITHLKQPAY